MPYIYKIQNDINDKVYIGKTLYTIERRWYQHKNNSTKSYLKHLPIYAAINKYGLEHFSITQIEEVQDYHILSDREQYWVSYYNSYLNGYNATRGGDGSLLYDYDWIWELWESGLKIKEITKEVNCNDFVVRTVLTLHNISTEERKNRSYEDQKNSHKPYQRPVQKLDINTNQVIEEYESVSEAAKINQCDNSYLSRVCNNNKIFKNYKWQYKPNVQYIKKDFSKKPVCQIDLQTNEILNIYESISAAARAVKGDSSYISKVCKGIQKSSKGFGWEYLDLIEE